MTVERPEPEPERTEVAEPDPMTDTGNRISVAEVLATEDERRNDTGERAACPACRGSGKVLTVSDLIRESLELFPPAEDRAAWDQIILAFYQQLLAADLTKPPADRLAPLFPRDLVTADHSALESHGKAQRDRLLDALLMAIGDYDPDHPESDQMRHLRTVLAQAGRSHAAFLRPDGSVRGAEEEEYLAVQAVLFDLIHQTFGARWKPEYDWAWHRAYRHAMRHMLFAQEAAYPYARVGRIARAAR